MALVQYCKEEVIPVIFYDDPPDGDDGEPLRPVELHGAHAEKCGPQSHQLYG